uniref:RAD51 paralog D n=1 Tax=Erpetoichthys calabaricus TaxID=27687 RepID=A0A8C4S837_ERPCA
MNYVFVSSHLFYCTITFHFFPTYKIVYFSSHKHNSHMKKGLYSSFTDCISSFRTLSLTLVAINRVLLAQYASFPINGADLYDELLSSTAILSTGNESLDKLLDSGLYTGEVTELIGSPGSGKTQVCLGVAANVACELKRNVVYIDSTGGLSASRLLEIVKSKVSTAEQQVINEMVSFVLQSPSGSSSLKAVIVDSVRAVLLPVIGGNQIEEEMKIYFVTNHVIRESNGAVKPGLGRSWSHVPRTRILLQHVNSEMTTQNGLRRATLLKSSRQVTVDVVSKWWFVFEDLQINGFVN